MRARNRRGSVALTMCLLAVAVACGNPGSEPPTPKRPEPAPRGVSLGSPATEGVGPEGGSVTSFDERLTVNVPPGALPAETAVSVQEITNTAPGGIGVAYRLSPDGTRFAAPVAITFSVGVEVADLNQVTIAYQEPGGFWLRQRAVSRDPAARTVTTTATHFSDWALVPSNSARDLRGTFRIESNMDPVFVATGVAALDFAAEETGESPAARAYYVQWGSMSMSEDPPVLFGGQACDPTAPELELKANVAELLQSPDQFYWGVDGHWELACGTTTQFAFVVFDTLGVSYPTCARSWVGTPILEPDHVQGAFLVDCGTRGNIRAEFDFGVCVPGTPCDSGNVCRTAAIACDTGWPVCQETGNVADGTVCGTDQVCRTGSCLGLSSIAVTPASPSVLEGGT